MTHRLLSPSTHVAILAALLLGLVVASSPALASSRIITTYSIAQATATPQFPCTDIGCGPLDGYTYTGNGTCQAGCVGFPSGQIATALTFQVTRTFPPSPCFMDRGTGTLDVTWPADPALPAAQGIFTFKAQDAHTVNFAGTVSSTTTATVTPNEPIEGTVTFPPSPCLGGTAAAAFTFG